MAPLKRNKHTQLSMLHFTKRNSWPPENTARPVTKEQSTKPLLPTPRPSAPPFFEQPMPKPSRPRHSLTIADDAWEAADRFMKGHRLTPKKRAFEDDAPVMGESDDDFEPDVVTQRISRARPSSVGKSSASALRDDRASMTKRSANKTKRSEPLGRVPTQQRSVFADFGLPPKMPSLATSEEDGDDNHVVVFDGEKSSLSGTDNDDERGVDEIDLDGNVREQVPRQKRNGYSSVLQRQNDSPSDTDNDTERHVDEADIDPIDSEPVHRQKDSKRSSLRRDNSPDSSVVAPARAPQPRQSDGFSVSPRAYGQDPSQEGSPFPEKDSACARSFRGQVPRTVGPRKCSSASEELLETHLPGNDKSKRRKIRPLFNSDSDDSVEPEEFICRERHRRGGLNSPLLPSPCMDKRHADESLSSPASKSTSRCAAEKKRKEHSEGLRFRENTLLPESPEVQIVSTPKQHRRTAATDSDASGQRRHRNQGLRDVEFEKTEQLDSRHESPFRTPRKKRGGNCDTDERRKGISEYIATASPSLSPPSKVKKRRRFRRLIVAESSEEEDDLSITKQGSTFQTDLHKPFDNSEDKTGLDPSSGNRRNAEWYHERDIDEFSETSCDAKRSPRRSDLASDGKRDNYKFWRGSRCKRRRVSVKRDISKSFERSPDQHKSKGVQSVTAPTSVPQGRSSPLHASDSAKPDNGQITVNVENEVIDLVGEDEEVEISPDGSDGLPGMDGSLSPSRNDNISSPAFEDDAPPPFNLIALCRDGEGIQEMKERLGEDFVMDKVTEAQENGREIFGGEELGLTSSYNKSVFDCFSKTIVADQLGKERAAESVTEKALRGEYKFHYRGRERDSSTAKRRGSSWRGNRSRGRFANSRRRRGSS